MKSYKNKDAEDNKMKDYSISVLTPTTRTRGECLKLQVKNIKNQTYSRFIKEWIVVSSDKSWNSKDFSLLISELQSTTKIKVVSRFFIDDTNENIENIGFLRNRLNSMVSNQSNYIFAFDDDDYYHPDYVEHSIKAMNKSGKIAAGCTSHIMYDTDLSSFFQFTGFSQFHTVNNCLSYHKDFLKNHEYNNEDTHAEEKFFLKDFTSEIVQLDPYKTVVQMVHSANTYNKRKMIMYNAWIDKDKKSIHEITPMINSKIRNNYKDVLCTRRKNDDYDIVYYLGFGGPMWSPYDTNLGGSEQAVLHLSNEWIKKGKSVLVVGNFTENTMLKANVDKKIANYESYLNFECKHHYKTVILWRNLGILPMLKYISADRIYVDLHDRSSFPDLVEAYIEKIDKIFFKSKFHEDEMKNFHPKIRDKIGAKSVVIENGVRTRKFADKGKYERVYNRFCYTSCYTRGLYQILMHIWPVIRSIDDTAEFHVYYGMDSVQDEKFKQAMKYLMNQPGVYDWGRQSIDVIKEEKCKSTFQLYVSKTKAETDCIAVRESAVAGCIPLLSNDGVFAERPGIHFEVEDTNNRNEMVKIAFKIIGIMRDEKKVEDIRNKIKNKDKSWLQIAKLWLRYF